MALLDPPTLWRGRHGETDPLVAWLTSGDEEAHAILPGATAIDLEPGTRLSLIPFVDFEGLDLSGVKWPLAKRHVGLGDTLTLSNVAEGPVTIGLIAGYGIALVYPQSDND